METTTNMIAVSKSKYLTNVLIFCMLNFASCRKCDELCPPTPEKTKCNVSGTYVGYYWNQFGQRGDFYYILEENGYMIGSDVITKKGTAYGGYFTNCDTIIMKTYNIINNSNYRFNGKFSNSGKTINGIYQNLTTPSEIGPFYLERQ